MTPADVIAAYLKDLRRCLDAFMEQYAGIDREGLGPMMAIDRHGGSRSREGELTGLGEFKLHGYGCRVELISGASVDFDWDPDGAPVFDGWRLHCFAESMGWDEFSRDELTAAAEWLAGGGLLDARRRGWFAPVATA